MESIEQVELARANTEISHTATDKHKINSANAIQLYTITSVYREKKHPYDCFTNLSEDKSMLCGVSNHG